jgi:hypothetical protein
MTAMPTPRRFYLTPTRSASEDKRLPRLRFGLVSTIAALLLSASPGLGAETVRVRTLDGASVDGELVSISAKEIVLTVEKKPKHLPVRQVLAVDLHNNTAAPAAKYTDVELTDGSLLHCAKVTLKGRQATLQLPGGQEIKAPLAAISYILNEAEDPKARERWKDYLAKRGNNDLVVVDPGGGAPVEKLSGTLGDADAKGERIAFETEGLKTSVPLAKIAGMSFLRPADAAAPPTVCKVFDTSRNELIAAKIGLTPKGFTVTTVSGLVIDYARTALARLDFSHGTLAYLSDLEPTKVVEKSGGEYVKHYRRDRNLDGDPIRLGGTPYDKGLALHAYTELVYDLGGRYKEFATVLGVDGQAGGNSDVKVTFYGDDKELHSYNVKRADKPQPVKLLVKDVRSLRIVVRSANEGELNGLLDLGNHVDLADARVIKE